MSPALVRDGTDRRARSSRSLWARREDRPTSGGAEECRPRQGSGQERRCEASLARDARCGQLGAWLTKTAGTSSSPTPDAPKVRRDTARTRDRLLDAAAELLAKRGTGFSLPDLARASGVATATVYRHFNTVQDVERGFYHRLVETLVRELGDLRQHDQTGGPTRRLEQISRVWVELVMRWGAAAIPIRSAEGFLARVQADDPPTAALRAELGSVFQELVDLNTVPAQDVDYAILLWITIFDERVMIDLADTLGWTSRRIARTLLASLLGAWQSGSPGSPTTTLAGPAR